MSNGDNNEHGFFSARTRRIRPDSNSSTRRLGQADATQKLTSTDAAPTRRDDTPSDRLAGRTQLAGPDKRRPANPVSSENVDETPAEQDETEPGQFVTGWLVVLSGSGRGRSVPLRYGLNSLGRSPDQKVCVDFGDGKISRENHCSIAYDTKSRNFFIQHGGGQNLTYMDDTPVLAATPLEHGAVITVGDTELGFYALCGPDFEWSDEASDE